MLQMTNATVSDTEVSLRIRFFGCFDGHGTLAIAGVWSGCRREKVALSSGPCWPPSVRRWNPADAKIHRSSTLTEAAYTKELIIPPRKHIAN